MLHSSPIGRVLLVLTTSGSGGHLRALKCSHAAHRERHPLMRDAEVALKSTRALGPNFLAWFQRAFPNRVQALHVAPPRRHGQQEQVIETFVAALRPSALARYDWVVVSNVDVVVVNATRLAGMLANPQTWAVLANCNPDRHCAAGCTRALVHSDFFAFRPRRVRFHNETRTSHAETYVTKMFRATIALGRDAWIQARGFNDRSCRIRAGVRAGRPEVVHDHRHCA